MTATKAPQLLLKDFSLQQNSQTQLALSALGGLALADGAALPGFPELEMGVGVEPAVPQRILAAFPGLVSPPDPTSVSLWAATPNPRTADPAWYLAFSAQHTDIFGVHTLADNALTLTGATFSNLTMRTGLQVRGGAIQRVTFAVSGMLRHSSSLAGVDLTGLDVDFNLDVQVTDLGTLNQLLSDPETILDAAFFGSLRFSAGGRRLALGNAFRLDNGRMQFAIQLHSPGDQRQLILDEVTFSLNADRLDLVGVGISNLAANVTFLPAQERLAMSGSVDLVLPSLMNLVLDQPIRGSALQANFTLAHEKIAGNGNTLLELSLAQLRLDPAINLLELSAQDLRLSLVNRTDDPNGWELAIAGSACQSWGRLAQRLATQGILQLPTAPNLPDLRGSLQLHLQQNASQGDLHYRLDFLAPGTGCVDGRPEQPFRGALTPLPVRLADAFLDLRLGFDQAALQAWQVQGQGVFSSMAWLHDLLPIDNLQVALSAEGSAGETPTLKLALQGGLPALELPSFASKAAPLRLFQVDTLSLSLGSRLELNGTASLLAADLVAALELPADWKKLLDPDPAHPLLDDVEIHVQLSAPLQVSAGDVTLAVHIAPKQPPVFELMRSIGVFTQQFDATRKSDAQINAGREFFTAAFTGIHFLVSFSDQLRLELALELACVMFGESFDISASLRLVNGEPELLLMGGLTDPIRLVIPGLSPDVVLGAVDLSKIANDYHLSQYSLDTNLLPGVDPDPVRALEDLEQAIRSLFGAPGQESSLVFELRNLGLRVSPSQSPTLAGDIRLVQMPGFLDAIMPAEGFALGLGSSVDQVFVKFLGPVTRTPDGEIDLAASTPLFSIPFGRDAQRNQDRFLHFFLGEFSLFYSWTTNAFGFTLDAAARPEPTDLGNLDVNGTGIYVPQMRSFVSLSSTVSAPPIPIPEWALSFRADHPGSAAEDMGLQLYTGTPTERYLTIYFRENRFSPTYFLMQPGLVLDGGVIIGKHDPNVPNSKLAELIDGLQAAGPNDQFLIEFGLQSQLILMQPALGLLLNPLAAIPPFISPMPPFWLSPPQFMFDIFFGDLSMTIRLPYLLFFTLRFKRPAPTLSLQGMLELAALVMTGFKESIPDTSSLKSVFYVDLEMVLSLPLLEGLAGANPPLIQQNHTVNFVDILNGLVHLLAFTREALESAADISQRILEDPSILVRMVPRQFRHFELTSSLAPTVLGMTFSGWLFVLTPEEFEDELILYHENKRRLPTGLAASQPDGPIQPPPALQPIVNSPQQVQLVQTRQDRFTFLADPRSYFNPDDPALRDYVDRKLTVLKSQQEGNLAQIRQFRTTLRQQLPQVVDAVWQELLPIAVSNLTRMQRILVNRQLPQTAAWLQSRFSGLVPPSSTGRLRDVPQPILDQLRRLLAQQIETEALNSFKVYPGLAGSPQAVAQEIVSRSVTVRAVRGLTPLSVPTSGVTPTSPTDSGVVTPPPAPRMQFMLVVDQSAKQAAYQELISPGSLPSLFPDLERCFRNLGGPYDSQRAAVVRSAKIVGCLATKLQASSANITGDLDERIFVKSDADLRQALLAALFEPPQTTTKTLTTTVFDGARTNRLLQDNLAARTPAPPGNPQVVRVTGYEIRSREGLNPSNEPVFSVPVPVSNPPYTVQRQGGRYRLAVLDGDGNALAVHDLPAWLIAGPETPQKIDAVRARLTVTERREIRQRTAAEASFAEGRVTDHADHYYQSSILAQPEYQLKPQGGLHGPLTLADLLKRDSGSYVVPTGPVLLAGLTVELFDNAKVSLAGMLAGPDSIFLNGYHKLDVQLTPATKLHLEGEFHLIAGEMWQAALAGSSQAQAAGLTANSLSFNGFAELTSGGASRFRGQAAGTIQYVQGNQDDQGWHELDLTVAVEMHQSWTLEIAGTELVKATLEGTFDLEVHLPASDGESILQADVQAHVKVWTATFKEVEITPPFTVCGPFDGCVTVPAITVPDLSNLQWQPAPLPRDFELRFTLDSQGLKIEMWIDQNPFTTLEALN